MERLIFLTSGGCRRPSWKERWRSSDGPLLHSIQELRDEPARRAVVTMHGLWEGAQQPVASRGGGVGRRSATHLSQRDGSCGEELSSLLQSATSAAEDLAHLSCARALRTAAGNSSSSQPASGGGFSLPYVLTRRISMAVLEALHRRFKGNVECRRIVSQACYFRWDAGSALSAFVIS